jgi:hypothetical protein
VKGEGKEITPKEYKLWIIYWQETYNVV